MLPVGKEKISRELTFRERPAKSAATRCEQAIQYGANGVVEIVHIVVESTLLAPKSYGLDSVELELDFVFTSSSDSKQLDLDKNTWWARGHFTGSELTYLDLKV
ncbi:unnamed protein product [Microthlaspi erraticum]|uniref:Uncharacterized protein n=1 Tax=Microthlaspi erraticum TaxID=1685480 RepID=A0A6D2I6N1_9BRAS|nr:unnamed protein product [Microthlaspi erraticum]